MNKEQEKPSSIQLWVTIPSTYIIQLDKLRQKGLFISRNEAIRIAIRDFLEKCKKEGILDE